MPELLGWVGCIVVSALLEYGIFMLVRKNWGTAPLYPLPSEPFDRVSGFVDDSGIPAEHFIFDGPVGKFRRRSEPCAAASAERIHFHRPEVEAFVCHLEELRERAQRWPGEPELWIRKLELSFAGVEKCSNGHRVTRLNQNLQVCRRSGTSITPP